MISSVLSLGSLLMGLSAQLYPDSKDIKDAAHVADNLTRSYNVLTTTSVQASAARTIIAPMVVIEASSIHQEWMSDLMQIINLRDIVATLTHLAMQSGVGMGVKVENLIGSINPKRAGLMALAGIEKIDTNIKSKEQRQKTEAELTPYVQVGGKTMPDLNEYTPLAVGRTVIATIPTEAGKDLEFPLTFRQVPVPMDDKSLERVFSAAKIEDGLFARLDMVSTKEITIPQFLSGSDIVKERFKIKNEDLTGYYKEVMKAETNNRVAALRTGIVSVNNLANTFVFSSDKAQQLELAIGRRFSNESSRNEIFKAVKANTIVVVDEDRGIFTFYTHGYARPEIYTRKDIATKSKKDSGSNNLSDLVKLLNGGM